MGGASAKTNTLNVSTTVAVVTLMIAHAALLAWSAWRHSPVAGEYGHLPSGLHHLQSGNFDLYRVNPPLVRMVAAIPLLFCAPETDWHAYTANPLLRAEWGVGKDFLKANGFRSFWFYTLGRWACIPFSLVGGYVCFLWARELYGTRSGLTALALWCLCPNILGNAPLIMPDVPSAALGTAACYTFWRWLGNPTWSATFISGFVLGLAELTKTTLIAFYAMWPVLWAIYRIGGGDKLRPADWLRELGMLVARMAIGVCVINMGYGYEGSLQPLGEYRFQSEALRGREPVDPEQDSGANRFAGTILASVPVPLPKNYVQGIDTQKYDFDRGKRSYLNGNWSDRGYWYFYLFGLALKVPLGIWLMVALAMTRAAGTKRANRTILWRDEMCYLLPMVTVVLLVSSQTGFSIHFRYVLPAFPFLFLWASKAVAYPPSAGRLVNWLSGCALGWFIAASLFVYPHSLAYFNEFAGGAASGHEHLIDSSSVWGQDMLYLKQWYDEHPDARPLHVATWIYLNPRIAEIDFLVPPVGPRSAAVAGAAQARGSSGPQTGWFAVEMNYLHSTREPLAQSDASNPISISDDSDFSYFLEFEPVARVGFSFNIYHISLPEANRVRRELGLPLLDSASP